MEKLALMKDIFSKYLEQIRGVPPLGPPDETENPTQSSPASVPFEEMAKYHYPLYFDPDQDAASFPRTLCEARVSNGHSLLSALKVDTENPTQSSPPSFSHNYPYNYPSHFDSKQHAASFPWMSSEDHLSNGHSLLSAYKVTSPYRYGFPSSFLSELAFNSGATPSISLLQPSTPSMCINVRDFIMLSPFAASPSSKKRKRLQSDL
ncbi:uncharacterized protein BT62DRAFT_1080322 [Guyanagaster necrorhizus]|uniref:Uncharacterized protein n=1 Tax=Guyanagaster necrorhizus TaxID=856835 RepID=A0A9P7VHH6_9AGAR|nr:uncharacterized protein BT62DRAFT_1080322 [Guyanagaster necrorhizus MCA 3950]KAG7441133.1 hypothetical protein BT62DRAFT_1080322 [Guyanagaster necrorhizus MCA 3950]